jgi:hypothetical protein
MLRSILLLAACAGALSAQVSGPIYGYVWDSHTLSVHPLRGVPGAWTLGAALDLPFAAVSASVAPVQNYLLANGADGLLRVVPLAVPLNGAAVAVVATPHGLPEEIVFSPSGTAALLRSGNVFDVVTGLPGAPVAANTVEQSGTLSVSDAGEVQTSAAAAVSVAIEGRVVRVSNADGQTLAELECACRPTSVTRMKQVYRLTEPGEGPIWFLDLSGAAPRLTFVPDRAAGATAY